ncbi:unnamed protein product [Gongylonema pulchrum]|uniref:Sigma-70 family RNA polymerase sigma factor n=1 Tax=Gongylonema pulchrum TaxID=637853 RepID=A0A183EK16_9BILA|nr:unnamed protein product [Gongylonema pulchrum]
MYFPQNIYEQRSALIAGTLPSTFYEEGFGGAERTITHWRAKFVKKDWPQQRGRIQQGREDACCPEMEEGEEGLEVHEKTAELLQKMAEQERAGQAVIMGKRAMVEFDERRQKCREALRQLRTVDKREWGILLAIRFGGKNESDFEAAAALPVLKRTILYIFSFIEAKKKD